MILRIDEDEGRLLAELDVGGRNEEYECLVRMCDNPTCTCDVVHMTLVPEAPETGDGRQPPRRHFSVNLEENSLCWKDESAITEEDKEFAERFLAGLDDDGYAILYGGLFHYKNRLTEEAPPASIDVTFDYDEIENEGLMVSYNDLLPYGDRLEFDLDGNKLVAYDQYCVSPHCSCTDLFLHLFNATRPGKPEDTICTILLEYREKKWTLAEDSPPADIADIRSVIEKRFPDLYRRLRGRHKKLKAIYAHSRKKCMELLEPVLRIAEPPVSGRREITGRGRSPKRSKKIKSGRNDPCPCGSGKKYKKCCLRRDKGTTA